ncbi:MAG: alpha/beta fold hydrolase [Planctomycetales bacterium]|nr:alpha/beta fold hydrolase [Planctomycetales bacterium]
MSLHRLFCLTSFLSCFVVGLLLADDVGQPTASRYKDHSKLLVYLDDSNTEHAVRTREDWAKRRRHVLDGMQQAMGPLPSRSKLSPLDVKVDEEVAGDGFVRQKITFVSEGSDRVPAYLFLPQRNGSDLLPAMLALHQTTGIGKGEPAGIGGLANLHYGLELARRGYVVLCPDYPSFGDYKYDFAKDEYVSGTMKGIFNHIRGVDLLVSRPEVDSERIGVIGHSLGGHNAMFVGVFDERLKVIVSSCGWNPFHEYYGGKIAGWTSDRYMPRLRDVYQLNADLVPFDFYGIVAAFAPRAFFSNSPLKDSNFEVSGVKKAEAACRPVFDLLGAAEALQVRYPDCAHDFPPDVRREAYQFIDRVLKHQPTKQVP